MKVKVSDLMARFFEQKKMQHIFGIIGAGNCHIFDSVFQYGKTEIVCVHHEQAATMAMQTYYRTCGTVTVALLTTGGGSSNGVTGVLSAWADSIPGLIISGNENQRFTRDENPLRMYGIQGYDSPEMVRKITKYATRVMDATQTIYELEKALFIATAGRPGPCWVDVPMSIQSTLVDEESVAHFDPDKEGSSLLPPSQTGQTASEVAVSVEKIQQLLAQAKRPLFWLGNGIRLAGAETRLQELLDFWKIPALLSWSGIDMIDSGHPLVYGRAGVYGQRAANFVLQNCDLLITIGTRLAIPQVGYDISELARAAKIVVVDIDKDELAKYKERFDLTVCADAKVFLSAVLDAQTKAYDPPKDWIARCDDYRARYPWVGPEHTDCDGFINSYPFMERLNTHLKPDQIIVTDMGTALLSGHQVLRIKPPQRLMTSQGLGEMGFGLPGAIGASFARNKGEVLCLNCDGGMMMNLQELQTMVHHKLPIKLIIFSNDGYLMIKNSQKALFNGRQTAVSAENGVSCPDFRALAKAFNVPAYEIRTWDDFELVIPLIQAEKGPAICEVFMHPQQPFFPKLSLAPQQDGSLISPPLEDLSPLLSRAELAANMIVGLHPKSQNLKT